MKKTLEIAYLKKWGCKNKAQYVLYVKEKMEDLEFIAPQLFQIFQEKVIEWEQKYLRNGKKRFVAETISPLGDKLTKAPERVVEKILESWETYSQWQKLAKKEKGKEPIKHDPKDFLSTMPDLIRFRILCNYLSDIKWFDKKIQDFAKKSKHIKLLKWNDYIETPFPQRRVGHRALQYVFEYLHDTRTALFEVQLMTQLEHAWDKKDHHLIYEYDRIDQGVRIPLHLRNRMAAMSEVLYVADTVFDSLRSEISEIMGE
jgi:ppGpp synthetase/RelA/SpoT-type nucleotidyltranferase